jgi:hypothetical protein
MVSLQESVFSSFVSGYCTVEIWRECCKGRRYDVLKFLVVVEG